MANPAAIDWQEVRSWVIAVAVPAFSWLASNFLYNRYQRRKLELENTKLANDIDTDKKEADNVSAQAANTFANAAATMASTTDTVSRANLALQQQINQTRTEMAALTIRVTANEATIVELRGSNECITREKQLLEARVQELETGVGLLLEQMRQAGLTPIWTNGFTRPA